MTYSIDFRWKVFSIKEKEVLSYEQTANRFDIEKTTLVDVESVLNLQDIVIRLQLK